MARTPQCILCQASETEGLSTYESCIMENGQPCFSCRESIELEAKILEAKQALNTLLLLRSGIRSRVNRSHDPITVRLPPEIVSHIFEFSLPDKWEPEFAGSLTTFEDIDHGDLWEESSVTARGPLRLGAVCTAWRDIAWSTPSLWTVMRLDLSHCANPNSLADVARDWLNRSGQLPLSIHISYFPDFRQDRPTLQNTRSLLACLDKHSRQWENLDVIGPEWLMSGIQGSMQGSPNLRRLRVSYQSTTTSLEYQHRPFSLCGPRPRVSHLTLDQCRLQGVHVEWSALSSLVTAGFRLDECIDVFKLAPHIVHCEFCVIKSCKGASPVPSEPIIVPNLNFLKLDWAEDQNSEVMDLLRSFTFPKLTHLHVEMTGHANGGTNNVYGWAPLVAHIERSSPPLTSFTFHLDNITFPVTECLIPVLNRTPLLRHLRITDPFGEDETRDDGALELFGLLSSAAVPNSEAGESFLPVLESIEFQLVSERGIFWECAISIFASMGDPVRRPLNTLRIRCERAGGECYFVSKDLVECLLALERSGVVLDIRDTELKFDIYKRSLAQHGLSRYAFEIIDTDVGKGIM